jgi:hypothetical protein
MQGGPNGFDCPQCDLKQTPKTDKEYEFDEFGGHKPIDKGNGRTSMPMFACAGGCPARFFTNDARVAHIKTMHPTANSGPTEEMIQLARIRPELAESFGIDKDQLHQPMNVREFEEQNRISDVLAHQNKHYDKITSHPSWRHFQVLMSDVRMLHAAGMANSSREYTKNRLDEHMDEINTHGTQFVAGVAMGKSVHSPEWHLRQMDDSLDSMLDYVPEEQYKHHDGIVTDSLNKMVFAQWKPGEYDPKYDKYREPYDG